MPRHQPDLSPQRAPVVTMLLCAGARKLAAWQQRLLWLLALVSGFSGGGSMMAAPIQSEAWTNGEWGVGRVAFSLSERTDAAKDDRVIVRDRERRLLYPVSKGAPMKSFFENLLQTRLPGQTTYYFIFQGDAPLELEVYAPAKVEFRVVPQTNEQKFSDRMTEWWTAYKGLFERVQREREFPATVQNYLTAVWADRLGQTMPDPPGFLLGNPKLGGTWLTQLMAGEAYRTDIEREIMLGRFRRTEITDQPLPKRELELPLPPGEISDVELEGIVSHVPQECFYVRFGSFQNYLWCRDFLTRWQGDLGNMIVQRSQKRAFNKRTEQQLALKQSATARTFGPAVIRDVAFVGLDPYFRDGAAFGIIFEAKNNAILSADFQRQRRETQQRFASSQRETVQIEAHDVDYLATKDGRVRSYYAQDGDFHLVTNCRTLVERFYQAAQGIEPLAASAEFQRARREFPQLEESTLFAFCSSAWGENLASPGYRIELARRLRSIGEMRLLRLAQLAGQAESGGNWGETVPAERLAQMGLIPPGFGTRADGSFLIQTDSGGEDSLRGAPGFFLPIPDVPLEQVSPAEIAAYREFAKLVQQKVRHFVPIAVVVRRQPVPGEECERVSAELKLWNYEETGLADWASKLGDPESRGVVPIPGDVLSGEIVLNLPGGPVHLFGGMRDFMLPLVVQEGRIKPQGMFPQVLRGYFGAWPRPAWLGSLFPPRGRPDRQGVSRSGGLGALWGIWQHPAKDFLLFAFHRDVSLEIAPQLAMAEGMKPAQLRLRIADFAETALATAVTGWGYARARDTSASGSRFMNSLVTQLHVEPEEAEEIAEQIEAADFVCPLGGEYALVQGSHEETALWASSSVAAENRFLLTRIPLDYELPLLRWFHGLDCDLLRDADSLTLHADLDILSIVEAPLPPDMDSEEESAGGGWSLPSWSFLNPLGKSDREAEKN